MNRTMKILSSPAMGVYVLFCLGYGCVRSTIDVIGLFL